MKEEKLKGYSFRCFPSVYTRAEKLAAKRLDRFENTSHFIRCALMRFIREIEADKKPKKEARR